MMSGTAYNPYALSPFKNHVDLAFEMADQWENSTACAGACESNSSERNRTNLVEILKVLPLDIIQEYMNAAKQAQTGRMLEVYYSPVIESNVPIRRGRL